MRVQVGNFLPYLSFDRRVFEKSLIISHRQDIDGVFFAVLATRMMDLEAPNTSEFRLCSNSLVDSVIEEYILLYPEPCLVIIGDLNPSPATFTKLINNGFKVIFIDHHSAQVAAHNEISAIIGSENTFLQYDQCATQTLCDEISKSEMSIHDITDMCEISKIVNDRDLFLHQYTNLANDLHMLYSHLGPEELFYSYLSSFTRNPRTPILLTHLLPVLKYLRKERTEYIDSKVFKIHNMIYFNKDAGITVVPYTPHASSTKWIYFNCIVIIAEKFESDIADMILQMPKHNLDVVFIINTNREFVRIVTRIANARAIASYFGGTGNGNAGGVPFSKINIQHLKGLFQHSVMYDNLYDSLSIIK